MKFAIKTMLLFCIFFARLAAMELNNNESQQTSEFSEVNLQFFNNFFRYENGQCLINTELYAKKDEIINLLKQGANPHVSSPERQGPLHVAAESWAFASTYQIYKKQANNNNSVDMYEEANDTVSLELKERYRQNLIEIVDALISHGAEINRIDNNGNTALHRLAFPFYSSELLKRFLLHSADPSIANNEGSTILHYATSPIIINTVAKYAQFNTEPRIQRLKNTTNFNSDNNGLNKNTAEEIGKLLHEIFANRLAGIKKLIAMKNKNHKTAQQSIPAETCKEAYVLLDPAACEKNFSNVINQGINEQISESNTASR